MSPIRRSLNPLQWRYVPTQENLANLATRSFAATHFSISAWPCGPQSLHHQDIYDDKTTTSVATEPTDEGPEVRPVVQVLATKKQPQHS